MSLKLIKHIIVLALMIALIWWNYEIILSGQVEATWRNPFVVIFVCGMFSVVSVFWIFVELLKLQFANNPKVMERLNGDFWTILLGPVKKDS